LSLGIRSRMPKVEDDCSAWKVMDPCCGLSVCGLPSSCKNPSHQEVGPIGRHPHEWSSHPCKRGSRGIPHSFHHVSSEPKTPSVTHEAALTKHHLLSSWSWISSRELWAMNFCCL
jgi:hypothetical protein